MKHTNTATIRAYNALSLPLKDVQWWSCDAPVLLIPATLPPEVEAWLARHPEASDDAPFSRGGMTTAELQEWRVRFNPSIRSVLAAPAKHKPAEKRAYRRRLGLVG